MSVPMTELIPQIVARCEDDCRVYCDGFIRTHFPIQPTYDKHGHRIDVDTNKLTAGYRCHTCKRIWKVVTQGGQPTTIEPVA